MMGGIVRRVQADPLFKAALDAEHPALQETASDAITAAAKQVATTIKADAIVTYTTSGSTTLRAARERPNVPILCLTANQQTARRLTMVWGVHTVQTDDIASFSDTVRKPCRITLTQGFAQEGGRVIITAGVPFGTPGAAGVTQGNRVKITLR
jgi:pyruvate kinase